MIEKRLLQVVVAIACFVPLSVGGSANYTFDDESVLYRLMVPADQFEA